MNRHRPEVADVFRSYGAAFLDAYADCASPEQKRVLKAVCACRTAALGGHKKICDHCGHELISYNSCRNRHCPKCQGAARARWLDARQTELLNVPYFHVVFTVPETLGGLALQNKRLVYSLLFRAVSQTLLTIARDPKHLGAEVGFLAVLHTWGQNMGHHPHIHCVIPAGGISPDGTRWIPCREGFFVPVRVLSRLFANKLVAYLRAAYKSGKLDLYGSLEPLRDPENWHSLIATVQAAKWVVYAKPPFGGPAQVLKYLARYTHRVAISNRRLISLQDGKVTFQWKDYAKGNRRGKMTLEAVEFIRRFLLHVFPNGFVHIRYYGFMANRLRADKLALATKLIARNTTTDPSHCDAGPDDAAKSDPQGCSELCPACKQGRLVVVEAINPDPASLSFPVTFDTS
jgi:hypothetical protein